MKTNSHRFLCALCALTVFISALFPASAFAAQAADTVAQTTLTTADAREMQQADSAVTALTGSDAYAEMTRAQRLDAAVAQLQQLAEDGLVSARSLQVDEENGMVSFAYSCGALGGVLVEDPDEENTPFALSELPAVDLHEMSNAPQGDLGSAMIYYAFDNTVNSSRYPYYSYMKGFWTAMGLHTRIDSTVTVSDLKRMNDYGLCILSAHGSYYTYTSGFLFKQTRTEPVILLTEESDFYKDLYYGIDLLTHRVIKINGLYCITPNFFQAAYRGGQLKDTVVLSETCEFLGVSGSLDTSMADALLAGGAKAVAGYVNNVYTVYSRSMLWDTVNHLILGQTLQESVQHSMDTYGADDLVWYNAQGGKRPHAAAAYPLLFGDVGGPADRTERGTCPTGSTAGRLSVALLLDLYYTGGWQKLLSSLLIYLSVCFADSWQNGKVQASR